MAVVRNKRASCAAHCEVIKKSKRTEKAVYFYYLEAPSSTIVEKYSGINKDTKQR